MRTHLLELQHHILEINPNYQVVQNCDELFDRPEISAAPDIGWPDLFNTGASFAGCLLKKSTRLHRRLRVGPFPGNLPKANAICDLPWLIRWR